jgi:hypothetical protein
MPVSSSNVSNSTKIRLSVLEEPRRQVEAELGPETDRGIHHQPNDLVDVPPHNLKFDYKSCEARAETRRFFKEFCPRYAAETGMLLLDGEEDGWLTLCGER